MTTTDKIRQLQPGEPVPAGEPRRYRNGEGYIRLRWKVGPRSYVDVYEHRLVAGLDAPAVHHRNKQRDDNNISNLKPVTTTQHGEEHATWPIREACELYRAGWSLPRLAARYAKDSTLIMRALKLRGVQMRGSGEWKRRAVDVDAIREMFAAGLGRREMAKRLNISDAVVARVMREHGLKRGPGRVARVA